MGPPSSCLEVTEFRENPLFSGHGSFPASKLLRVTDIIMDDVLEIEWGCKLSKEFEDGSVTLSAGF
jgi:hypothetical protein